MAPNVSLDPGRGRPLSHGGSSYDGHNDGMSSTAATSSAVRADGYPTRHHSQGVVASHFLAHSGEDETWLQFLRHGSDAAQASHAHHSNLVAPDHRSQTSPTDYTLPNRPFARTSSSSSRSSDRKRRLTTVDSPMRRPSSIRMHSENAGNSRSDPIVLDSSPLPERPLPPPPPESPRTNTASLSRRQSDVVPPPWQPDSEVSQCPVCGRQFTFLYRKHHCRYVVVCEESHGNTR